MLGRIGKRLATAIVSIASFNVTPALAHGDPLETFNRAMHRFNQSVYDFTDQVFGTDRMQGWVPSTMRTYLVNFYANMTEPATAVASLLRGEFDEARTATRRFIINLTLGYGGLVDRATEFGIHRGEVGFGETLCKYGVPDGPYLVLPFYGPSTISDFLGSALGPVAGYYAFGLPFAAYRAGYGLTTMVDDSGNAGFQALRPVGYETQRQEYFRRRALVCGEPMPQDLRSAEGDSAPVALPPMVQPGHKPLSPNGHAAVLAAVPSM